MGGGNGDGSVVVDGNKPEELAFGRADGGGDGDDGSANVGEGIGGNGAISIDGAGNGPAFAGECRIHGAGSEGW